MVSRRIWDPELYRFDSCVRDYLFEAGAGRIILRINHQVSVSLKPLNEEEICRK
jgi:hypothetical protein